MEQLLIKKELNQNVSREAFLEDIHCLFEILKGAYGLFDYFGEKSFLTAKQTILEILEQEAFVFHTAVTHLIDVFFRFIKDGHFRIGPDVDTIADPGYAVRETIYHGIPMIQCRKLYYDTPSEKMELEQFSASFSKYRNSDPLILDLRDNAGGSDLYIWDFLTGLFGVEPDYPCLFVQRYSPLFQAAAGVQKQGIESWESDGSRINCGKQIYVLINENTASSAEAAIAYLKTNEDTTVVGTHSAGCFTCGNCITIYLPHSHLPVYFGTGMVLYEKTRNLDAEGGFQADISFEAFRDMIIKKRGE